MTFEWRKAERVTAWAWVPLMVLTMAPWGMHNWPLAERAVPIMWLCLAGAALLFSRIARASWPFAALLSWAVVRSAMNAFPLRSLQLLLLCGLVGLLYVAAREMPSWAARLTAWALMVGVAWELAFGYLNLGGIYPWMTFVVADQVGRPMGFLTHPNYWGSLMALATPVAWALLGPLAAVAIAIPVFWSYSAGPAISLAAGAAVLVWPDLGRRAKYALLAGASAAVSAVMFVHEWRLSGRREVWLAAWPELWKATRLEGWVPAGPWYFLVGQGFGRWREWADYHNAQLSAAAGSPVIFATLQAHNEPYQLWFELGLVGVALAGLWCWQAGQAVRASWPLAVADPARRWWQSGHLPLDRAWIAVLAAALVNALGSPTFHLPAQAAIVVFALARVQAHAAMPPAPEPTIRRASRRRQGVTQHAEDR